MKLCFWNKRQMTNLLLMQLANYRQVLTRKITYQFYVLIDSILCLDRFYWFANFFGIVFDASTLFYAFYCSAPAAWIKVLSFGACFKCVASFGHPLYLLRTSPRSILCAWNSRIWHFHLNNTLLPRKNVWNLVFATVRPDSMKLTLWGLIRWNWHVDFERPVHIRTLLRPAHAKRWSVAQPAALACGAQCFQLGWDSPSYVHARLFRRH